MCVDSMDPCHWACLTFGSDPKAKLCVSTDKTVETPRQFRRHNLVADKHVSEYAIGLQFVLHPKYNL